MKKFGSKSGFTLVELIVVTAAKAEEKPAEEPKSADKPAEPAVRKKKKNNMVWQ